MCGGSVVGVSCVRGVCGMAMYTITHDTIVTKYYSG